MEQIKLVAEPSDVGIRLDKWLSEQSEIDLSRSSITKLIESKDVLVNAVVASKSYKIANGDVITLTIPDPIDLQVVAENIPIEIVYEDSDLIIVNKPKDMVVHPAPGNYNGTLVNALLYHCKEGLSGINGVIRPGIVHRIDKNTSGLLIVAKNDKSHTKLAEQIKAHTFTREYEAICVGRFKEVIGTVDAPIGRDKNDRKKMRVTPVNSKNAVTHYTVLEEFKGYSHLKFTLETGRTHQIRVHCAYMGHPVLGDDVYGKEFKGCKGQCLHAKKIGFIHPTTGEYVEFTSELPEYFEKLLERFRSQ